MSAFELTIPALRLGEFDMGGVLYHANYFHLYEMAREALLQTTGVPYLSLVENDTHLAIVESHQNFFHPIFYGQIIKVSLSVTDLKRSSLRFNYQISVESAAKNPVHLAWTNNVCVAKRANDFKVIALPDTLRNALKGYEVPASAN